MFRTRNRMNRLRARPMLNRVEDRINPVTVTTLSDLGPGSLSEAINLTNASPGADTIDFSVVGTITLTAPLPTITEKLAIIGPGADKLTVDGADSFRMLRATSTTNFELTVKKITIANGLDTAGGGIFLGNAESLVIEDSRITGCTATGSGGGIYFFQNGFLTMRRTTVDGNAANGGNGGGGIYFYGGTAALIENSTISGNTDNSATGGGGIEGFAWSGSLDIRNSTITGNTTNGGDGGAYGGGGIRLDPTGPGLTLSSTIVANNTDTGTGSAEDILCSKVDATNSLIGVTGAGSGHTLGIDLNNKKGTVATPLNPNLKALGNYGGPTPTHEPNNPNPNVINAGLANSLLVDQRGMPRVSGAGADIGSVEFDLMVPSASGTLADVVAGGGIQYQFDVTYSDTKQSILTSTIGPGDILVTGPNGFSQVAAFSKVNDSSNGSPRIGTYSFVPPNGTWDVTDNGLYSVAVQANEVTNVGGTPVQAGAFANFSVRIPQNIVVDTIADVVNAGDGKTSLREAIAIANNTAPSPDTITFDATVFKTAQKITLAGSELTITDGLTIQGPGAKLLSIDGNKASRVFFVGGAGVLNVTFKGLTISNGQTNNGPTSADSAGDGAGVFTSNEDVTFDDCVISNNLSKGEGGGISVGNGGFLTLRNSTLSGNHAGDGTNGVGGGVYFIANGQLLVENTTVTGNSADGEAGGIYFWGAATLGTLVVRNSTFSGNKAGTNGGGIACNTFTGTLLVQNSTITGNKSDVDGTGGSGGGIAITATTGNTLTLESSIIFGNSTNAGVPDDVFMGDTVNATKSFIGTDFGVSGTKNYDAATSANLGVDPMLDVLADNGGPTLTHALKAGSPAINQGSNLAMLTSDQRGSPYVRVFGTAADVGAFEVQPSPVNPAKVGTVSINKGDAQRSRVTEIAVPFTQIVNFSGPAADAFQLKRQAGSGGGDVTVSAAVDNSGPGTVVTLTFTGTTAVDSGSLADGFYTLTVLSSKVSNAGGQLDGNGDGTAGGDFVLVGTLGNGLFRLFGDSDGNGTVTAADFNAFRLAYGSTGPSIFDFDGNNQVSASDFNQFRTRYGVILTP